MAGQDPFVVHPIPLMARLNQELPQQDGRPPLVPAHLFDQSDSLSRLTQQLVGTDLERQPEWSDDLFFEYSCLRMRLVNEEVHRQVKIRLHNTTLLLMGRLPIPARPARDDDLPNIDERGVPNAALNDAPNDAPNATPNDPLGNLWARYDRGGIVIPTQDVREEIARVYHGQMARVINEGIPGFHAFLRDLMPFGQHVTESLQPLMVLYSVLLEEQKRIEAEQARQRAEAERERVINVHGLLTDALHYAKEALDLEANPEVYQICERIEAQLNLLGARMAEFRI